MHDGPLLLGSASATASWVAREAIDRHRALHNPGELTVLLRLLDGALPRTVLEIGTWSGGSAWAWSRIKSVCHIVTVDMSPQPDAAARLAGLPCQATQIIGDSTQPSTFDKVRVALGMDKPDVVVIDGGHEYATARRDWDLYHPLAGVGGVIVLHDTQGYPGNDTVQVPLLWAELRASYLTTEIFDLPGGPGGTGIVWM